MKTENKKYKDSASRVQNGARTDSAEAQPVLERKLKDSGIPWIGLIPEDWGIEQLSGLFSEHKKKNSELLETNLLSLSYGKIIRKDINTKEGLLPQSFDNYNVIDDGDIVFRLTDLQNDKRSLRTGLCTERGIITSAYITIRKRQELDSSFFHYLFHSYDICKVFYGLGDGVRQGMNYADLRKLLVLLPPLPTQQRIADFLDRKCAEIDELAALQETMIAELKRYKQSVITEAVTKGLDKNVKLKDSEIPWIGEIPNHWVKCSVKQIMKNKSIKGYPTEQVLSLYRDWGVLPKDSRDDNHNVTSEDTSSYKLVDIGDFVLNKMKAWQGSMAVSKYRGIISPAYYICSFVDDNIYRNYFHYLLRNETYKVEYRRLSTGLRIGQWDLNIDDFLHIPIIVPPLSEQQAIADYLDEKCSEIDELIAIKQQKIEQLKEYKKSVIFEYVTGKKEV